MIVNEYRENHFDLALILYDGDYEPSLWPSLARSAAAFFVCKTLIESCGVAMKCVESSSKEIEMTIYKSIEYIPLFKVYKNTSDIHYNTR